MPIDAGIRYTDRIAKRMIAGLYVIQEAAEFQGASNFSVLRYLQNNGDAQEVEGIRPDIRVVITTLLGFDG